MTLAATQQDFLDSILTGDAPQPEGWDARHRAGMNVYRNAYRTKLIDTLTDMFERTARWTGEQSFQAAAAHHVITHPPSSWTLDHAGEGFDATLAELFAGDPEVAELGWLEGAMNRVFVAADAEPLDAGGFGGATASFGEMDWAEMRLSFLPGMEMRAVRHDLTVIWKGLAEDGGEDGGEELAVPKEYTLADPMHCVVWREGLESAFQLLDDGRGFALQAMLSGTSYGEMCGELSERIGEQAAAEQAGAMLAGWLNAGWLTGVTGAAKA